MAATNPAPFQSTESGKTDRNNGKGFLDLSAELRNQIYDLAADSTSDTIREAVAISNAAIYDPEGVQEYELALAQSCRQIRAEYMPVLRHYISTRPALFSFSVYDLDFGPLMSLLRRFGSLMVFVATSASSSQNVGLALTIDLCFKSCYCVGDPDITSLHEWANFMRSSRLTWTVRRIYKAKYQSTCLTPSRLKQVARVISDMGYAAGNDIYHMGKAICNKSDEESDGETDESDNVDDEDSEDVSGEESDVDPGEQATEGPDEEAHEESGEESDEEAVEDYEGKSDDEQQSDDDVQDY